jgi:hypothetical protein
MRLPGYLPVADAGKLVRLGDAGRDTFTYPAFEMLRQGSSAFTGLAAAMRIGASRRAEIDGVDSAVAVQEVSGEYFDVLGVQASAAPSRLRNRCPTGPSS